MHYIELVVQRVDWSMLQVQDIKARKSDLANDFFSEIFKPTSFLIEHAGGQPPGKRSKQLTFPRQSKLKKRQKIRKYAVR